MTFRRFSAAQLALCSEWYTVVETPDEWIDRGPIGEGESQSVRVEHKDTGLMGVAKPGPAVATDTTCRAAHEKIAFDLAHGLELPIPPVVLWPPGLGIQYLRGRSISAWAFPQAKKWDEAQRLGFLTPALISSAGPIVSAMRVFHTWISDTDRKSDHTQIDLDSSGGQLGVAFIDHAFSMSQLWKQAGAAVGACPAYMPAPEMRDIMMEIADRIAAVPDGEVERVVNRIPANYLPSLEQGHVPCEPQESQGELACLVGIIEPNGCFDGD